MDMEFASKGVGTAGLTTGIIGSALGVLNGAGGLLGGLMGNPVGNGCNMPVSRYEFDREMGYVRSIEDKNAEIAYLRAENYSDKSDATLYREVMGKIAEQGSALSAQIAAINQQLGAQAVANQATKDSFQLVQERLEAAQREACTAIAQERSDRKCADNAIVNYVNATFYPKMVADVTTGTTTTAAMVYNPLPVCGCDHC